MGHVFGLPDNVVGENCMKPINLYHIEISDQLTLPDESIDLLLKDYYGVIPPTTRRLRQSQKSEILATSGYDQVLKHYI
jgi:hypothetical protein